MLRAVNELRQILLFARACLSSPLGEKGDERVLLLIAQLSFRGAHTAECCGKLSRKSRRASWRGLANASGINCCAGMWIEGRKMLHCGCLLFPGVVQEPTSEGKVPSRPRPQLALWCCVPSGHPGACRPFLFISWPRSKTVKDTFQHPSSLKKKLHCTLYWIIQCSP